MWLFIRFGLVRTAVAEYFDVNYVYGTTFVPKRISVCFFIAVLLFLLLMYGVRCLDIDVFAFCLCVALQS